jgi:uncharacterized repeat protein (TIGR01451 family)
MEETEERNEIQKKKEKIMKRKTFKSKWKTCFTVTAMAFMAAALLLPGSAMAAPNQGTGDVGGIDADITNSNIFSLSSTTLSLTKTAFLADGSPLATGDTLARGTEVRFVIYVDNTTTFPLNDVSIQDVLDPAFTYITASMKASNAISTGASQAFIYSTVNAAATVTDGPDGDVGSYGALTIDAGNQNAGNSTLDIAGSSVWAILFRALMQ